MGNIAEHTPEWMLVSKGMRNRGIIEYYVCKVCRAPFILYYDGDELPKDHLNGSQNATGGGSS